MKPGLTNRQLINALKLVAEEEKRKMENNEQFKSKPEDLLYSAPFNYAPKPAREETL
jgi:hypothetical protein